MSSLTPMAVYGLEIPAGDIMIPAAMEFPAMIRITMAALDPTEEPEPDADGNVPEKGRSTLRIFKQRVGAVEDSDDEEEDEYLQALLANGGDDDEEDSDDEDDEPNGGPSDPSKSKKARQEAAIKKLLEATQDDDSDEEMDDGDEADAKPNGLKSSKGKEPATDDDDESDEESDSDDGVDLESYVVCTLDTERSYQQPLDITIGENEKAFFLVTGSHSVHLTGNYVDTLDSEDDEDDEDYDLPPDMDELLGDDDISSDELDEIEDMERIKEIDTDDEEEAPKLVATKKGKKRPASDDDDIAAEGLDDMIAKEIKAAEGEVKLSKKQMKKLKNNKGEAVAVKEDETKSSIKETSTPTKSDKKVQFAKNLEQGPTGSAEKAKSQSGPALGKKVVQGVTIDDKKLGTGRLAKNGDKVSMRYIGKLENGKVFDSNKKGTPFTFKVGKGEVIKGWDVGIAGMSVGGERRIIIPASMGYGSKKMGSIPANSTLVFDVKLLEIK